MELNKNLCEECEAPLKSYENKICYKCKTAFNKEAFQETMIEMSNQYESIISDQKSRPPSTTSPDNSNSSREVQPRTGAQLQEDYYENHYGGY